MKTFTWGRFLLSIVMLALMSVFVIGTTLFPEPDGTMADLFGLVLVLLWAFSVVGTTICARRLWTLFRKYPLGVIPIVAFVTGFVWYVMAGRFQFLFTLSAIGFGCLIAGALVWLIESLQSFESRKGYLTRVSGIMA